MEAQRTFSVQNTYPLIDGAILIRDLQSVALPLSTLPFGTMPWNIKLGNNEQPFPFIIQDQEPAMQIAQRLSAEMQACSSIQVQAILCLALRIFENTQCWQTIFRWLTNLWAIRDDVRFDRMRTKVTQDPGILIIYEPINPQTIKIYYKTNPLGSESTVKDIDTYRTKTEVLMSFTIQISTNNTMQIIEASSLLKTDPTLGVNLLPMLKAAYDANKKIFSSSTPKEWPTDHEAAMVVLSQKAAMLRLTPKEISFLYPLLPHGNKSACAIM